MNVNMSMKTIVLVYGFTAGAILAAMMLLTLPFMHAFSNETGMVVGYTTMVLAFLLIFFGVRSYRDKVGGGQVRFLKALGVGVLIGVLASACYVATWEAIYFRGQNDFIEKYQAHEIESLRKSGATDAQIAAKQAELQKMAVMYHNPIFNSAITFMEPLPVAIVFALVSAGVLSRRRKESPLPVA
jgi:hypothetical protein